MLDVGLKLLEYENKSKSLSSEDKKLLLDKYKHEIEFLVKKSGNKNLNKVINGIEFNYFIEKESSKGKYTVNLLKYKDDNLEDIVCYYVDESRGHAIYNSGLNIIRQGLLKPEHKDLVSIIKEYYGNVYSNINIELKYLKRLIDNLNAKGMEMHKQFVSEIKNILNKKEVHNIGDDKYYLNVEKDKLIVIKENKEGISVITKYGSRKIVVVELMKDNYRIKEMKKLSNGVNDLIKLLK